MIKKCKVCGKEFTTKYKTEMCSEECRLKQRRESNRKYKQKFSRERTIEDEKCVICGRKIDFTVRSAKAITCSVECSNANARKLTDNWQKRAYQLKKIQNTPEYLQTDEMKAFLSTLRKEEEHKTDPKKLIDANAEAKKLGISYGEYKQLEATGKLEAFKKRIAKEQEYYSGNVYVSSIGSGKGKGARSSIISE